MAKILKFHRKPKAAEYEEFHNMWVAQENDWVIWRCNTCSRKVMLSKKSNKLVIERKGNFYAHHTGALEPTPAS